MSELPKGWAETTLEECCEVIAGQSPPGETYNEDGKGLAFYQGKAEFGDLYPAPRKWCTKPTKIAEEGDVLISVRAPVGPTNLASETCCIGRGLAALRPYDGVGTKFVLYQMRSSEHKLAEVATGSTFSAVSTQQVKAHPFVLASVDEQDRIVAEIEKHFTRLDAATAALKRVQVNLKRYRASVLKAACEGRLVPTEAELARKDRRDYEPASELLKRILRERRARWEADTLAKMIASGKPPKDACWKLKYKEPSAPDTSNLPTLPEGWSWASLEQLVVDGPQNGIYKPASEYGTGCPIVRIDDYQNDWCRSAQDLKCLRLSDDERDLYHLSARDVLVNRVNSPSHLGKSIAVPEAWSEAVFESNMMRIEISGLISVEFLVEYLHSTEGRARLTSKAKWAVNQASINQEDVKVTPVPLPPQSEQARIVDCLTNALAEASRNLDAIAVQILRVDRLRQAILLAAFFGRLVPQDAADVPASALLAHIRAERASLDRQPGRRRQRQLAHA